MTSPIHLFIRYRNIGDYHNNDYEVIPNTDLIKSLSIKGNFSVKAITGRTPSLAVLNNDVICSKLKLTYNKDGTYSGIIEEHHISVHESLFITGGVDYPNKYNALINTLWTILEETVDNNKNTNISLKNSFKNSKVLEVDDVIREFNNSYEEFNKILNCAKYFAQPNVSSLVTFKDSILARSFVGESKAFELTLKKFKTTHRNVKEKKDIVGSLALSCMKMINQFKNILYKHSINLENAVLDEIIVSNNVLIENINVALVNIGRIENTKNNETIFHIRNSNISKLLSTTNGAIFLENVQFNPISVGSGSVHTQYNIWFISKCRLLCVKSISFEVIRDLNLLNTLIILDQKSENCFPKDSLKQFKNTKTPEIFGSIFPDAAAWWVKTIPLNYENDPLAISNEEYKYFVDLYTPSADIFNALKIFNIEDYLKGKEDISFDVVSKLVSLLLK